MGIFLRNKRLVLTVAVTLLVLAAAGRFVWFVTSAPGSGSEVQFVEVGQGASLKRIAADLERARLVTSARLFVAYSRLRGADARIKAGTYQFTDGMSPDEILRRMVAGEVFVRRFAIPEGYSIYQIAEMLEGRGIFTKAAFLRECTSPALLKELGIAGKSVEGYLYPSTYDIPLKMDEAGFIRLAVGQFDQVFDQRFAPRLKASGLSKQELLIIASMVEKEAARAEERPLIASVFLNRLQKGMMLQSDPTAVYGVRAFAGNVTKRDVMRNSSYNTYRIKGLPPGPIGNPGGEAVEAVLTPARSDYLYFVAKKDGTHYFSTSLAEHNRAVRTYLKTASTATGSDTGYVNDVKNPAGRR